MPNVHKWPAKAFRPEPDEYAKAKALLAGQSMTMDAYLRACLRLLVANPASALDTVTPYWPPSGKGGED